MNLTNLIDQTKAAKSKVKQAKRLVEAAMEIVHQKKTRISSNSLRRTHCFCEGLTPSSSTYQERVGFLYPNRNGTTITMPESVFMRFSNALWKDL